MMHSRRCITSNTRMNDAEKNDALDLFNQYERQLGDELKAAEATFNALEYKANIRRKDRILEAQRFASMVSRIERFAEEGKRYGHALLNIVSSDAQGRMLNFNLEDRSTYYRNDILSHMGDLILKFGKKGVLGLRGDGIQGLKGNKNAYADLLKEAEAISLGKGPATNNQQMRAFAQGWLEGAERARYLKNKFGGNVPKMEGWFIPQSHSGQKVSSVSRDEWKEFVLQRIDRSQMVDYDTGAAVTDLKLEVLLNDVYDAISKSGYVGTAKKQYNKTLERHRILKFKDAKSWIEYSEMFGDGDVFKTMVDYADKMSRDIAELEILGPRPQQTLDKLTTYVQDKAAKDPSIDVSGLPKLQDYYSVFKRKQLLVDKEWLADVGSSVRNVLTSAFLGKAVLSAISDSATSITTMKRLGKAGTAPIRRWLGQVTDTVLSPSNSKERKKFLIRAGIVMDDAINIAHAAGKFAGETDGPIWSQVLADVTMRAQGLTAWTQSMRNANALEMMSAVADNLSKNFDELDPEFQITLRRYELDKDWDILRQATPSDYKGVPMLTKNNILDLNTSAVDTDVLAANYGSMLINLINDAVIIGNIKASANLVGAKPRGSIAGEVFRSAFMFKTFPVTVFMQHLYRMVNEQGINSKILGMNVPVKAAKAYRIANFVALTTMFGALAEQLHQLAKGKDPADMTEPGFWGAALTRGGGLGFVGDVLNEQMMGYKTELFGPLSSFTRDTYGLTIGNVYDYATGEDPKFADDLLRYLKQYTPGNSLWYGELALDRLILEQTAEIMDPGVSNRLRTSARRQESRNKQRYFWSPGKNSPTRGPRLGAALGE